MANLSIEEREALAAMLVDRKAGEGPPGILTDKNARLSAMGYQLLIPSSGSTFAAHQISGLRKLVVEALAHD